MRYRHLQPLKLTLAPPAYAVVSRLIRLDPAGAVPRPGPVIYACLHRDIIPSLLYVRPARPALMVSRSPDGDILIRTLEREGFVFVRGSTGADGGGAFLRLLSLLRRGRNVGLAVDGPRGPFGTVHAGVIRLSSLAGAPIVPLRCSPRRHLALGTWDRTIVPLPLSRVDISEGEPLQVPEKLDAAGVASWKARLQEALGVPVPVAREARA